MDNLVNFYKNKKVFITGNTGFKGSWLSAVLLTMGADVQGYSHKEYPLFKLCGSQDFVKTIIGDIRDYDLLHKEMKAYNPDIVFHLAAQPLVIDSYENPRYTYETNVMGTVNVLEAVRFCRDVHVVVNVTTDKVYKNNEWFWGYRETDMLNGFDPYSNSKSCSEIITDSYRNSFFSKSDAPLVFTARAGNVIGGGDFSRNRIIPECIYAAELNKPIIVRNRDSVRPWQHVLEPLYGYLLLAMKACHENPISDSYNFGPNDIDCVDVGTLVNLFCTEWGDGASWVYQPEENPVHEATFLRLDCSKAQSELGWRRQIDLKAAVQFCIEWKKEFNENKDARSLLNRQIITYFKN